MRSYNDDLMMARAVGGWVRDTALAVNQRDAEYAKAFVGAITKSSNQMDTRINGMVGTQKLRLNDAASQHQNNVTNFPWLFKG